jgi:hypothetical protein
VSQSNQGETSVRRVEAAQGIGRRVVRRLVTVYLEQLGGQDDYFCGKTAESLSLSGDSLVGVFFLYS